jgi:PAS domain S-box-containing protein
MPKQVSHFLIDAFASEERYRLLVEKTNDLIWELDRNGAYSYVNPRFKELLGYEPEELIGKTPFEFMPPEEAERLRRLFQGYSASGQGSWRGEVVRFHKDGRRLVHETNVSPIFDAAGAFCGFRGITRDVTERKRVEQTLQREHRVLRQLLRAQDRDRQLIAYEIHDGLAQQLAAAGMLFQDLDRTKRQIPEEASEILDAVHELLGQSLAEARRLISGVRSPIFDESGVAAAIEHLVRENADRTTAEISFRSKVRFDRLEPGLENAIYRIAQECLSNACRHSESEKVQVELVQQDDVVQIIVQDWGIGFDPQAVDEKCFGLVGIRERARLLGGEISIETGPGEGSRIVVTLPTLLGELDG